VLAPLLPLLLAQLPLLLLLLLLPLRLLQEKKNPAHYQAGS
jgi:hypothetical protein